MFRNPEVSKKKSTTDCKISKNRSSKNSYDPVYSRSNKASDNKTKNGRARVSRSEVTLKNGDGNKANVNTVAAGKVLCSNEPGKTNNAQEKIEVNLLNKQTPRNIENIFYKQINDCMKNIKNTSLLVDVVQAAGIQDGRRYSKYRTIPRKKMAHDKNNSSPKGGTICYEFDRNNIIKKRRPQTTPLLQRDTTKFEILRKSTSGNKLIAEKDFLSKIPVLARYLKGKYLIGSINKAKTSPELKFRWYNGQKPNSIKIQQKYVDLWANSAEYCKKVHGKTKIALPEEKSEKICEESGNFSIPFQSIDVKRTSSLQPIMKKPIVSKIPRTISSLTFSSISKVGNDAESIKETCKSQQRIASKIPVGVRSNIGIVKKDLQINDVQNSTPNDNNLPVNKITHTEGLNVPPNKPIECNGNLSKKKLNPIQTHKKGLIDKSKALEAKRGVENMCKRRIHFCCGDRNDDIKVVHKRFPGKVMNKVIKPKKTLNFKHRTALVNNKADLKLVISSPEIIKPIDKDPSPVIEPEKLLVKNVELEEKIKQNKTGDLMISRNVIPFSDTNLLKDKNCIVKSLCLKKRYPDYRSEKYVQTVICNNDIGIQVDYSAKDLQQISKEGKNANVTFGYGDWKFPFSQQEVGSNAHLNAILDYCADLLKTKNDLEEVLMQCSVFENVPSTAIGCQSEELSLKDSFSQTICCATDKSCQCFQTHHSISFTLTTNSQAPHSLKDTSRNKSDFTTANKSQFFLPSRNTSSNVCIAGLDNPDCKYEMACYCKEAPLDQKADIQAERQRNLYEDDEDGEEYSEPYMAELVNTVQLEDETKMCGSMPSLPDVAMPNDRCESKIEIPWLKISLAPPGYYQIKNKEGHPTKVVCDCWALSTGDDVYVEALEKQPERSRQASGPEVCTCQDLKTVKHSKAATRKKISKMSEEKKDENIPPDPKAPSASRLKSRTFQKMKGGLESMKPNWDWETEKYGETTDEQLRERTYKMLTDGVGAVKSGVGTVKSGVGTVKSGVGTVKSGVGARLVDMTNVRDATSDEPTNKPKIQKQSQRLADTDEKPGADEEEDETAEEQSEPTKEEPEPIEEELEPAKEEASEEQPKTAEETVEEPAETAEEKPAEPEAEEEKPKEPETDEGKPEEEKADEQPEIIEPVPVIVPEGSKTDEGKPEEGETGEEKPEGDETGEEKPEGDEDEASKPEGDEDETSKPEGEPEEPKEPSEPVAGGEAEKPPPDLSSSSDSIPSTCTCLKQEDECADIMGKPTAFVYDNPCFGQHEMYMDPIYKLFPEDCDTYCGPHIEMPWSELTIPRNIKLRVSKRPKGEQGGCMCDKGEKIDDRKREQEEEEVIVCGNKDNAPSPDERAATKPDDDAAADMQDKEIEIQLSITQSTGDPPKTGDKSTDIRPTSREKGTNPNFICTCADLRQSSPMRARSSKSRSPQCKCSISRSSVKMNLDPSHTRSINQTCDHCSSRSQRRSPEKGSSRHARSQDPVMNVLETCEAEMVPLRDTLNQLKSKIRNLNIPELSNWNAPGGRNASCPPCPPMTMRMMPSQPMVNRPPCCMSSPTQKYQSMSQTLAQYPSMFSGMPPPGMPSGISGGASSPMPPSMFSMPPRPMTSMRGCCPHCSCKEMRMRMRRTGSSSTDYSDYDYDSVSEGESLCPFLRALSSKNIYRERDSKSRRKSRGKDYSKTSERSKRKSPSSAKRYNKRSQAESCRNDNCTDTEPEIQVHYEPKRPRIKTKQVFKTVVDPSMAGPKSQRLRIAVRVSPSGEEMYNDKLLAIQGPADTKDWSGRRSQ